MFTLTIRSLAQLALVGISTAAAIASSDVTATPDGLVTRKVQLSDGTTMTIAENPDIIFTPESPGDSKNLKHKRVDWQDLGTSAPLQDFCWDESIAKFTFGPSAPLASDCQKIVDHYANIRGKWTFHPSDFEGDKVVPLVKVDDCQFQVSLSGEMGQKVFFGDNDLRYYVSNQLKYAEDGRVQAEDDMACYVEDEKKYVQLHWELVKA